MNKVELVSINSVIRKYGLELLVNGGVRGPERPRFYSETPRFLYRGDGNESLRELLGQIDIEKKILYSSVRNWPDALEIVANIFWAVTGREIGGFARFIVMDKNDFSEFSRVIRPKLRQLGQTGDFNGINLGGLVVIEDQEGSPFYPLAFHEAGHSMYPYTGDIYIDEFRAMYFQIVATKTFEMALLRSGIEISYPEDYYASVSLPSVEHSTAFRDARTLAGFLFHYDKIVAGDARAKRLMGEYLQIIRQPFTRLRLD